MSLFSWLGNLFSQKPAQSRAELGRNDLCWCGSGKKYKKCHLDKDEKNRYEEAHAARVAAQMKGAGGGGGRRRPTAAPQRPAEKSERRGQ